MAQVDKDLPKALISAWLERQCAPGGGVARALALLFPEQGQGPPAVAALWPRGTDPDQTLSALAFRSLEQQSPLVQRVTYGPGMAGELGIIVAHPLVAGGRVVGALALGHSAEAGVVEQSGLAHCTQAAAAFQKLFNRPSPQQVSQSDRVLQLLATILSHDSAAQSATALATELATSFQCDRVSLGFAHSRYIKVEALSHGADFEQHQALLRDIAAAMDECADQAATLVYPLPAAERPRILQAHAALAQRHGNKAMCSVPLAHAGEVLGVLTLERKADRPFEVDTTLFCEHVACLLGPIVDLKRKKERSAIALMGERARASAGRVFGPAHLLAKLAAVSLATAIVALAVVPSDYRVNAPAQLEGSVQRALVAPTEGFLKQAHVRPGDQVKQGQLLAQLDEEELKLERRKWESEAAQHQNAYGEALARQDRALLVISQARIDEAQAQLALVDEKLSRTQIRAPFDGVIIKGDLAQSLGAPVKRGDVLLTVAPNDDYRVIVEVDERDVADVKPGQVGKLAFSAMPQAPLPIVVKRVTPVSATSEGRHYFEVECALRGSAASLRPGLKGIAKIQIGARSLLWIWGHRAVDWLRLAGWRVAP